MYSSEKRGWLCKIFRFPIQLKLGLYRSGSFHPASQTKIESLPAVWMLYWLLPSPQKLKCKSLAMKEGGFLEVAGGN
jgi:hypothetical protein